MKKNNRKNIIYHSFKIFPWFWLSKSTCIIQHNQLLVTKFGRRLGLTILRDPGAVIRVARKGKTKVFKYRQKSPPPPWVPTLNELFPKIEADASSWLGTKNALYYCAQSANSSPKFFREFVHDGYCLVTLARFVQQACACKVNFYFLLS